MTRHNRTQTAAYGAFLLACIAEAERSHTPEQVAEAAKHLEIVTLHQEKQLPLWGIACG